MSNFTQRTITGIIIVVVITSAILFSQYSFIFLLLIINILGLLEFFNLLDSQQINPRKYQGVLLSGSVFVSGILVITEMWSWKILLVIIPFALLLFITELFSRSQNPFLNLAVTFFGITYITIPCLFVLGIAFIPFELKTYHSAILLVYFLIVWASDTGAYLLGKQFGRHLFF
jgi:phosphatidate cytidylyltransferase